MQEVMSRDSRPLESGIREWAPLTDLFNKLPVKTQHGIFSQDVKLTCIDVVPEFLALGTNVGLVYWFDRKKKDLQRLKCEKQNVQVIVVKIISTVDYMVACGNNDGSINIFQVPKSHPDSVPENLKPKNKQVERYTVSELHKCQISALEWAKNGMKLFSGDKNGSVVLTEIDFYMHICKSVEILNEAYEVVQLSYNQQKLLISTTYRSIICQKQDKWKVCQVGKKDRKVLGKFGGIIQHRGPKTNDNVLYCTRPGLRMWIVDSEGNVNKTLLFKDLLCKECSEVPIINPISSSLRMLKPQKEPSFGVVLPFNDNFVLTFNNDVIYILDPTNMSVISTMSHFRSVLSVATSKDEIFILEEERSIVRVSLRPELPQSSPYDTPTGTTFLPIASSIKDVTSKLQTTNIIPSVDNMSINNVSIHTDSSMIMKAEEACESPFKSRLSNAEEKFNVIGKQQFSDKILFKQSRHKKRYNKSPSGMSASMSSLSSNSSEEKEMTYARPTLMTLSSVGVLPDLRSPESIQNDIEYKEKLLADVLDLNKVKIDLDKLEQTELRNNVKQSPENFRQINNLRKLEDERHFSKIVPPNHQPIIKSVISCDTGAKLKCRNRQSTPEVSKIDTESVPATTPACLHIPSDWKLPEVNLKNDSLSDNSFNDWEIV